MQNLIDRLASGERGLAIRTEIEIALFQPSDVYVSVSAIAAATKLRYVRADGRIDILWPQDWDKDPAETITLLTTLTQQHNQQEIVQ